MKKAQNAGQIFVYIIAIVVVGIILLVGYQSIAGFRDNSDKILMIQFQRDLESSINSITDQYGTLKTKEYSLNSEYKEVCFIGNYGFNLPNNWGQVLADYPEILDLSNTGEPLMNVFLIKNRHELGEKFDIGQIEVEGNVPFKCFDVTNSVLKIKIEGKGDHVVIS